MAQEYPSPTGGQLREEASKMRSDFEETVGRAKDTAKEKLQGVKESASEYYHQGLEKARGWEQELEGTIKERPITSVLIAAGVGIFFGVLWARR
jgi:ElaB/YqjD/DUF883 family membrane-anchored ribosome-binding protein